LPPGPFFLMVDLRADRERVAQLWDGSWAPRVPLAVAAALTFHETHRGGAALLSPGDYVSALDIAAAALARLAPIYSLDGRGEQVALRIDLARQRFCGGAAGLQCLDGAILEPLAIARGDVLPALRTIGRSAIEYLAPRRG